MSTTATTNTINPRLKHLLTALGPEAVQRVRDARILVIGAGGIGCELLKNLVLTGFQDIEVVDLDTIDVSNLNRQFLFRKKDVGQPKSLIAKDSVLRFNPEVKMVAHHGNVKNGDKFNATFIKQFTLVANALDNISARRHVNRLCVKAGVPLVECGSTGYLGQSTIHYGGVCECYDCSPKQPPKKFPICSIRSTPEKPVHCIEWSKQLFQLLFGDKETSILSESGDSEAAASVEEGAKVSGESVTEEAIIYPTSFDSETLRNYALGILRAFYDAEIKKKIAIRNYDDSEHAPTPINIDEHLVSDVSNNEIEKLMGSGGNVLSKDVVWSIEQNINIFVKCVESFWNTSESRENIGSYEFDKDNRNALDFVTASSNLRAHVFNIPLQSPFSVKQIAGNIVHAIATTNAMAAGLELMELLKIVRLD
jgi:ubiquitin-like 1-activating enzyme E1 B